MPNPQLHLPSPKNDRKAKAPDPLAEHRRRLAERARARGFLRPGQSSTSINSADLALMAGGAMY